jgi:hypothetical protein
MNEQDLEKRLRGVVEGQQPMAPQSLRRFARDFPEPDSVGARAGQRRLAVLTDRLRWLAGPQPYARRAQVGMAIALAVVVGVAGAGLLMNVRQGPIGPAASRPTPTPAGPQTPWPTLSTQQPWATASLGLSMVDTKGIPVLTEKMAVPISAAILKNSAGYLGVTGRQYGMNGIVWSTDGLNWNWSPPSVVSPRTSAVYSVVSDSLGMLVLGGATKGEGGLSDGAIWTSTDGGATWVDAVDQSVFRGIPVRLVLHGPYQYVAFGWSDSATADSSIPIAEWESADGRNWKSVAAPIRGASATVVASAGGFVLSGTPLSRGAADEPPVWYSSDGRQWTRARATDGTAGSMGPLASATVTILSHVYGVSVSPDGGRRIVASLDSGKTWSTVTPDGTLPNLASISAVASLSNSDKIEFLFATMSGGDGSMFVSGNGGVTWAKARSREAGGPTGTTLVELSSGSQSGAVEFLSFGEPGSGLGIWATYLTSTMF